MYSVPIPPAQLALLTDTVARLVQKHYEQCKHAFLNPDSLSGLIENLVETYEIDLAHAQSIIHSLAFKAAKPIIAKAI